MSITLTAEGLREAGGSADNRGGQADRRSSLAPNGRARYKNSYFYKRYWTHGKAKTALPNGPSW